MDIFLYWSCRIKLLTIKLFNFFNFFLWSCLSWVTLVYLFDKFRISVGKSIFNFLNFIRIFWFSLRFCFIYYLFCPEILHIVLCFYKLLLWERICYFVYLFMGLQWERFFSFFCLERIFFKEHLFCGKLVLLDQIPWVYNIEWLGFIFCRIPLSGCKVIVTDTSFCVNVFLLNLIT